MAYSEILSNRIEEILSQYPQVTIKKMFGGIAYMWEDRMFCGVMKEEMMVRCLIEKQDEACNNPHVRMMDFTGKKMNGFLQISPEGFERYEDLIQLINLGIEYIQNTIPKTKKKVR